MKIDFYILEAASGQKSLFFACQLLEKAYAEEKKVYVHANSKDEAERFDALLWTFRDDSFIPHNLNDEQDDSPIQIGWGQIASVATLPRNDEEESALPRNDKDRHSEPEGRSNPESVLLNLSREIPSFYKQFDRVIEIVFADPAVQQLARERYKQYRDQGDEINTIKLKVNET